MRKGFAEPGRAWQRHGQAWQGLAPLGNGKAMLGFAMDTLRVALLGRGAATTCGARALDRSAARGHGEAQRGRAKEWRSKDLRWICTAQVSKGIELPSLDLRGQSTAEQRRARRHCTGLRHTAAAMVRTPERADVGIGPYNENLERNVKNDAL